MFLNFLVVMDALETIDASTDTTFVCIEEARRRGHRVDVAHPDGLSLRGPEPLAEAAAVTATSRFGTVAVVASDSHVRRLAEYDVVLVRKDPPFDLAYFHATLVLERARGRTLLVNDPCGLREANEKLAILNFPTLIPETVVTRSLADLRATLTGLGGEMVVKPLDGCGGAGVFHVRGDDPNTSSLLELVTAGGTRLVMAQRYLPTVREGDKRILMLDGEPIGAVLRVPAAHETRANLHVGGTAARATLTARELTICAAMGPWCRRLGLALVGIDVIGGFLTEINVTSPTGFQQIAALEGVHLEQRVLDWLEERCAPRALSRRAA